MTSGLLSVVGLFLLLSVVAFGDAEMEAVAVRFELCEKCRLDQLPEVRRFLEEVAPAYASLIVAHVEATDPVFVFLDAYRRVLKRVSIATLNGDAIVELLVGHGIHVWTPAPEFLALPIEPTDNCLAWRQTKQCRADGEREPLEDERCDVRISFDRSGFCECSATETIPLDCDHDEGSCDQYCDRKRGGTTAPRSRARSDEL